MAPSNNMLFKFGILAILLASGVTLTYSAVCSVDLGSDWLKVAVVNLKPGRSPISIAINEMSKRKTPALVAFHDNARLLGEEAAGIVARYPEKVYSQIRDVLGKPVAYVKRYVDSIYLPFDIVEDSRGAASFKLDNGVLYSVEELLAMVLGNTLDLAEFHSKVPIKDAVLSVPAYFGQAERKGLLQAAELAGMNVLALVNEHSGAALQYGMDKDFSNGSRNVIFYDMGSKNTYAALVHFSSYTAKEYGKTVSINQFQVKDVRWDSELGGNNMESRMVEYFADEFNKQLGNGFDVRTAPKAMAKLKKQVKRTKEILSANTVAPISVESLYDDRDFRSSITREKFEQLCGDLWEKALHPLKEVIEYSGLKMEDIFAVELIGGATRVPNLQNKIQEFLGRKELDKHLDADEAIVLGSSLHAANLTDGIKLNRKLGMIDGSPYGFHVEFVGDDLSKEESTKQLLAPRMKKLPSKMFRSFAHNKDFDVLLSYESEGVLPPGSSSPLFAHYSVTGLASTSDKYSSRNLSSPVKASLHFSLSRSGILTLDRADAVIEVSEWVDVPKKNLTIENLAAGNFSNFNTTSNGKNETEVPESLEINESSANTTSNITTVDAITEKVLKKKTFRIPLTVSEKTTGPGVPLSEEHVYEAKKKLEELKKKDAERKRTAELKNNLEEYIYSTKEKLESSEEFQSISTSDERQSFVQKLEEVQDWLYTDGEDASASQFEEKLQSLKAIGDPMFFRFKELSSRPAAIDLSREMVKDFQKSIENWEEKKQWIPKTTIDEVRNETESFKNWLTEKEAVQNKMPASATPILTSEDVYDRVLKLQEKVSRVNKIPKPKAPKAKKNETESSPSDNVEKDKTEGSGPDTTQNHDEL